MRVKKITTPNAFIKKILDTYDSRCFYPKELSLMVKTWKEHKDDENWAEIRDYLYYLSDYVPDFDCEFDEDAEEMLFNRFLTIDSLSKEEWGEELPCKIADFFKLRAKSWADDQNSFLGCSAEDISLYLKTLGIDMSEEDVEAVLDLLEVKQKVFYYADF